MKSKEKFKEYVSQVMIPGQRNKFLKGCANKAKYYEIEEAEALSIIKDYWGSDFESADINSFKNAYKTSTVPSTYSEDVKKNRSFIEYVRQEKETESEINKVQSELNNEAALYNRLAYLKANIDYKQWVKEHYKQYDGNSSFMLNIFDKDDIVWVSNSFATLNPEKELKDMLTWSNKNEKLKKYSFYSINPFNSTSQRSDDKVYKFKYMLFESDTLEVKEQLLLLIDLINHGLPVKMITNSAGKSLHALIKLPKYIHTLSEYNDYVKDIFDVFNNIKKKLLDENNKNASRATRLPFGTRYPKESDVDKTLKIQKLLYLQDDDSKLQNDAREIIHQWADELLGVSANLIQDDSTIDDIAEDELLGCLKNRDYVHDIWDDGKNIHTFMKLGEYGIDGKVVYHYADQKWGTEKSFYNFIQQLIEEQHNIKVDVKELKFLKIRFKNSQKVPYVGTISPVRKDTVNTFIPGWLGKVLNNKSIPSELNEPLQKFIDNIFGSDEKTKTWTLQWMREFMHTFNVITAPVFWEIPGTGKTMFCKAFGEAIGDMFKTPPNMDDIRFNEWMNHTVIVFEECSSGTKKEGKALGDLFKDWITEKRLTIEAKGQDPKSILVNHCVMFNANISEIMPPVFIEDKDRRYTIVRNDNAVNLRDLWTDDDFSRWDSGEYQYILMKWIYNLPKESSVNVRTGLMNKWKNIVTNMGKSDAELAAEEFFKDHQNHGFIPSTMIQTEIKENYTEFNLSFNTKTFYKFLRKLGAKQSVQRIKNSTNDKNGTVRGWIF